MDHKTRYEITKNARRALVESLKENLPYTNVDLMAILTSFVVCTVDQHKIPQSDKNFIYNEIGKQLLDAPNVLKNLKTRVSHD